MWSGSKAGGVEATISASGRTIFVVCCRRDAWPRLDSNASHCRGFYRFTADHHQAREHREPKGEAAQYQCGGKARFKTPAHEVKKPGAGSFEGAENEGDRGQGRDHGGKYEAHKGTSDVNVQANRPAGAAKRCCIKEEDAGLQSNGLDD
jgi:hypothetical protein